MTASTFDTLTAARDLEALAELREKAKEYIEADPDLGTWMDGMVDVVASTVRRATAADREALATKADLAELRAATRADLYRALWIQAAALIGTQLAIAGFVVHLLSQ